MSTPIRRKSVSVIQGLSQAPHEYTFIQVARLLQLSAAHENTIDQHIATNSVAKFTPPFKEAIRFSSNQNLGFPSSEIASISAKPNVMGTKQWKIAVNFMGLTGSLGVLPYHYTEMLLKQLKIKDETMRVFFDLFNHRTISLFYQASTKYKLAIEYERNKIGKETKPDNHTKALLSIIGLGTDHLTNRLYTKDESLIYYSGHLSQQIRTSSGLRQILQHHFDAPIKTREFVGQWQELIDDVRTRMPTSGKSSGQNNCLGKSAMLGRKGWFVQGKLSIIIGPLTQAQLQKFAPGTTALNAMNELARLYLGMEYDYDFKIQLKKSEIPDRVKLGAAVTPSIGWNTWLSSSKTQAGDHDEIVEISISSGRLLNTNTRHSINQPQ